MSPVYFAVMVRADPVPLPLPLPLPLLPPLLVLELPQPARAAAEIRKNASPKYAYCLRRAASVVASTKLNVASAAAIHARRTNGVLRGRTLMIPGGSEERAVVNVAVQNADVPVETLNGVGVQVAAVPRLVVPFKNCTVPVGPCAELLLELTFAVSVTFPPDATLLTLEVTVVVVVA